MTTGHAISARISIRFFCSCPIKIHPKDIFPYSRSRISLGQNRVKVKVHLYFERSRCALQGLCCTFRCTIHTNRCYRGKC
jgi:hypothetical protein